MLSRDPHPLLVPFVQRVWATWPDSAPRTVAGRELLLPAPQMHLAFRLGGDAFRFFHAPEDFTGETLGHAVVGGVRTRSYVKALSPAARSVGALLKPGAGELLFGVPNGQLADCHVPLETLWAGRPPKPLLSVSMAQTRSRAVCRPWKPSCWRTCPCAPS